MTDRLLTIYVCVLTGVPAILTLIVTIIITHRQSTSTTKIIEIHDMVNGRLTEMKGELLEALKSKAVVDILLEGAKQFAQGKEKGRADAADEAEQRKLE